LYPPAEHTTHAGDPRDRGFAARADRLLRIVYPLSPLPNAASSSVRLERCGTYETPSHTR
jgi:hypothetical protein